MSASDLTGQRFGRLVALEPTGNRWRCRCDCEKEVLVTAGNLRHKSTKSCGCLRRKRALEWGRATRTHGHNGLIETPTYASWRGMKDRCSNPNHVSYDRYGGRGIKVCERWHDFGAFLADMGEKPAPGWHIDRIDNDGNYEPGNCQWLPAVENTRKRNADGRRTTL